MGCKKMELKKIFLIELIVVMLMIAITSPTIVEVGKAVSDTVVITFNPAGNLTLEVFPATWNVGEMYVNQTIKTSVTNYTAYNNGSVEWATLFIHGATASDMTLVSSFTASSDEFMLFVNGTTTISTWTEIHTNQTLESSVAPAATETFGLNITMDSVFTSDWAGQSSTITLTAVGA